MSRGKFITIEGQDGAGKSTNIKVMHSYLEKRDIAFVQTREPGGTALGEQIRKFLLDSHADNHSDNIGDTAELLLIFAARAQHIEQVIEPALSNDVWVLCDRFTDATFAYQGGGRGVSKKIIAELEQSIQGELQPDLTLVLDLPVEIGQRRATQRSAPDRFEQQRDDFKERVRQCYLDRAEEYSRRIRVVDASQNLEQVKDQVIAHLSSFCDRHG